MVAGNQMPLVKGIRSVPAPIGPPGTWQISYFPDAPWWAKPFAWYIGVTSKGGVHVRLGARWDDIDNYVEWPEIAWKRLK